MTTHFYVNDKLELSPVTVEEVDNYRLYKDSSQEFFRDKSKQETQEILEVMRGLLGSEVCWSCCPYV